MGRQGRDLGAEMRGKILRLALAGCTTNQIMERTGLSRATVLKYAPQTGKHKHDESGGALK